eukprot:g1230.t1
MNSVRFRCHASRTVLNSPQPVLSRRRCRTYYAVKDSSDSGADESTEETKPEIDYVHELGRSDLNMNIDTGQNSMHLDSLFTGNFLGHKSDIADGSLRTYEFRSFNNLVGDYYVAPRFMEKVAMHVAKNFLVESFETKVRIPLILGIWGPKGTGKSFQTELTFKKMGLEPIIMSAGELEHEWAGTPGRLIRERYRRASEVSRVHGKLSCLLINDLDAGIGHFSNTQITVNNQIVVGTLMNICDNPTKVSIGKDWRDDEVLRRIPIIVTGNDFSKLFAPLIRDGRMEKFYWDPNGDELDAIIFQMYKDDGLFQEDISNVRSTFPNQPLDFFGAIRAATYDNQIRTWIKEVIGNCEMTDEAANMTDLSKRLLSKKDLPDFHPVKITTNMLIAEGNRLAIEQERIKETQLSKEYMKMQKTFDGPSMIGFS